MYPEDTLNKDHVLQKIEEVKQNFHLVLILEMFDESLVLLADILCLPMDDMISLKGKYEENI